MTNEWFISSSSFSEWKQHINTGSNQSPYSMGGNYNGYVVVDKEHPYYGMSYDNVPVDVHGGVTWSQSGSCSKFSELKEEYRNEDHWVFGFDTAHPGDSTYNWTKERTENEAAEMCSQFYIAYIKKLRDDNRRECRTDI